MVDLWLCASSVVCLWLTQRYNGNHLRCADGVAVTAPVLFRIAEQLCGFTSQGFYRVITLFV